MHKQWVVTLTDRDRSSLSALIATGTAPARKLAHARLLLKADQAPSGPAWTDAQITAALDLSRSTVERVRKRYATEGLEAALTHRPPARHRPRRLDGAQEARLLALACSEPPPGQVRWTLRLLADRLVDLEIAETVSYQTVRRTLKKTNSSPGGSSSGASPRAGAAMLSGGWRTSSRSTSARPIPSVR